MTEKYAYNLQYCDKDFCPGLQIVKQSTACPKDQLKFKINIVFNKFLPFSVLFVLACLQGAQLYKEYYITISESCCKSS